MENERSICLRIHGYLEDVGASSDSSDSDPIEYFDEKHAKHKPPPIPLDITNKRTVIVKNTSEIPPATIQKKIRNIGASVIDGRHDQCKYYKNFDQIFPDKPMPPTLGDYFLCHATWKPSKRKNKMRGSDENGSGLSHSGTASEIGEDVPTFVGQAHQKKAQNNSDLESPTIADSTTKTPKTEMSKIEKTKTKAPKTETPKKQMPKTEKPKIEIPKIEKPKTENPKIENKVETEMSKIDKAKTEAPKKEKPETDIPEVVKAKTEAPNEENPAKTETPEKENLKTKNPKIEKIKTEIPKMKKPKTENPKIVNKVKTSEIPKIDKAKTEKPKTETPKKDNPTTEIPKKEKPETDMPKVEKAKTEAPKEENPAKTETPEKENLKTENPKIENIKTEIPKMKNKPKTENPKIVNKVKTEIPKIDKAKTEKPKTETTKTEIPETGKPNTDLSKIEKPKTEMSKIEKTTTETPKMEKPKIRKSDENPRIDPNLFLNFSNAIPWFLHEHNLQKLNRLSEEDESRINTKDDIPMNPNKADTRDLKKTRKNRKSSHHKSKTSIPISETNYSEDFAPIPMPYTNDPLLSTIKEIGEENTKYCGYRVSSIDDDVSISEQFSNDFRDFRRLYMDGDCAASPERKAGRKRRLQRIKEFVAEYNANVDRMLRGEEMVHRKVDHIEEDEEIEKSGAHEIDNTLVKISEDEELKRKLIFMKFSEDDDFWAKHYFQFEEKRHVFLDGVVDCRCLSLLKCVEDFQNADDFNSFEDCPFWVDDENDLDLEMILYKFILIVSVRLGVPFVLRLLLFLISHCIDIIFLICLLEYFCIILITK